MTDEYKRHLAFLLITGVLVLAAGLGLRDPWPADEPRFALIAREIVESGNWLLPHVGGVLYPDKPPLFFWLVAAFYLLSDSIRVAILLPGVLAGIGVLLMVTDLGRRLWGPKTGIFCGATLLATIQFPLQMKMGQIDGLLCLWTTLGFYGFCRHLLLGPDWRWWAIGGVAAGLGVITKGVGFLPYLVVIPYLFAARCGWSVPRISRRDRRWLFAPVMTMIVVAAWLVPMLFVTGSDSEPALAAYRENILFRQTVTRYADAWGHIRPPWYLVTNAASWLWMPVMLFLPWLVPAWARDLKLRDARVLLPLAWVVLVLMFFSLSDGKRSLYIFPALPAVALVTGYHARRLLQSAGVRWLLVLVPAVIAMLTISAACYVAMNPHEVERWLVDVPTILKTAGSLIATGTAMTIIVIFSRARYAPAGYATAMITFWLGLSFLVAPSMNGVRSGSTLMGELDARIAQSDELAFVAWPEQFLLQWTRPVAHFGYRRDNDAEMRDAANWLAKSPGRRLLLPDNLESPCLQLDNVISLGRAHRRNWVLADNSALTSECIRPAKGKQAIAISNSPVDSDSDAVGDREIDTIDRRIIAGAGSNL